MIKLPVVIFDNAKVLSSTSIEKHWLVFVSITAIAPVNHNLNQLSLFAIANLIKICISLIRKNFSLAAISSRHPLAIVPGMGQPRMAAGLYFPDIIV